MNSGSQLPELYHQCLKCHKSQDCLCHCLCCCCWHLSSVQLEVCGFALNPGDQADIVEELEEGALPEDEEEEGGGEQRRGAAGLVLPSRAGGKGPVRPGRAGHQPDREGDVDEAPDVVEKRSHRFVCSTYLSSKLHKGGIFIHINYSNLDVIPPLISSHSWRWGPEEGWGTCGGIRPRSSRATASAPRRCCPPTRTHQRRTNRGAFSTLSQCSPCIRPASCSPAVLDWSKTAAEVSLSTPASVPAVLKFDHSRNVPKMSLIILIHNYNLNI